jgi:hypothetical protein
MRSLIAVVLALVWLGLVAETSALEPKQFKSPKGYKLTYPDDWTVASPDQLTKMFKQGGKGNVPDLAILGTHREKYLEYVTMIIIPQAIRLDEVSQQQLVFTIQGSMTPAGGKPPEIKRSRIRIDGLPALSLACEFTPAGAPEPLRWWKAIVPGEKQTYVVTCTALKSQWDEIVPNFTKIINSLRVDLAK